MQRVNRRMRADMTAEQFEAFRTAMRKLRKENGLTLKALSDIVECSPSHINNIEIGKKYPSDDLAKDIAEVFDTTAEAMCGIENERKVDDEIAKRIGKAYREKRLAKNFGLKEVAGFAGIPKEVLAEFEDGKCSIGASVMETLDRLYKVETEVQTVEVVKEVPIDSVSLDTVDKILGCITGMNISKNEQVALFRELSTARTQILERQLFS